MTERKQFRLPDVGEGLTEADIVTWRVKPGDQVTINQVIVEIETAKAVVELPSPYEGVVAQLLVDEGQSVDVGTPIIAVDTPGPDSPIKNNKMVPADPVPAAPERQPVLVGYGVKTATTSRRPRKTTHRWSLGPRPPRSQGPPQPQRPRPQRQSIWARRPRPCGIKTAAAGRWPNLPCASWPGTWAST